MSRQRTFHHDMDSKIELENGKRGRWVGRKGGSSGQGGDKRKGRKREKEEERGWVSVVLIRSLLVHIITKAMPSLPLVLFSLNLPFNPRSPKHHSVILLHIYSEGHTVIYCCAMHGWMVFYFSAWESCFISPQICPNSVLGKKMSSWDNTTRLS